MPYALVGPGIKGVYHNWERVRELASIFPYCKFRKFGSDAECWEFVEKWEYSYTDLSLYKYGDTFDNLYVRMSYVVTHDYVYYNFDTSKFGILRLDVPDDGLVEYSGTLIMVRIPAPRPLDNNLIADHIQTIYAGINLLGTYIDVDVEVPDHSIYYALTQYSGHRLDILEPVRLLKQRLAEFSITLKYRGGEDYGKHRRHTSSDA